MRPTLLALFAQLALTALCACIPAPPKPPNFLLVTVDTLRADVLGAYGHRAGASPHIDAIAADGVRFDRAYTVTPLTIPAHSSLFTGLYPPRHGVRDNGDYFLGPDAITLAERLQGAGYGTGAAVGAEVTSHHWGFDQGFDAYRDDLGVVSGGNRWAVERPADQVVNDALDVLSTRSTSDPWFQWVHVFDVHHPYQPPEPYSSQMNGRPYLGEVAWTDAQLGVLFDAVLARADADRTWIVILADHGEGLGAHGEDTHGVLLYDSTTRIPLIIRPPGGGPSKVVSEAVSLVDVAPTLLALAGVPLKEADDGQDLGPVLTGAPLPQRPVYVESRYAHHHYGWAPLSALITPDHKLIHGGKDRLFGADDRAEAVDLAPHDPTSTLREQLDGWTRELEADESTGAALTSAQAQQLQALGYVVSTAVIDTSKPLPDPEDRMDVLQDLQRARRAVRAGPDASDLALLDALIAQEPGLEEPRLLRVSVLLALNRVDEASAEAEAIDNLRVSSTSRRVLGRVRIRQGRIDEGLAFLEDATDRDPASADNWVAWMQVLLRFNRVVALQAVSSRAIEARPDDLRITAFRAVSRAFAGDAIAVESELKMALQLDPGAPAVRYALGLAAAERGDDVQAERLWRDELTHYPAALAPRRSLVALYATQRRYEAQLEQLDIVLRYEAPAVDTAHSRAQVLFNLARFDEALPEVQRCRTLGPGYPACTMLLANVLKRLGRLEEAEAAYQTALAEAAAQAH